MLVDEGSSLNLITCIYSHVKGITTNLSISDKFSVNDSTNIYRVLQSLPAKLVEQDRKSH